MTPAPRDLSDLHGPDSSPTTLSRPSCTGASMRAARLRPAPYAEYWSRLPARDLSILSPSVYAVLSPLLPSNSLHVPGGSMIEMRGHSSNQFSVRHTGPGCLRGPPGHPEQGGRIKAGRREGRRRVRAPKRGKGRRMRKARGNRSVQDVITLESWGSRVLNRKHRLLDVLIDRHLVCVRRC